MHPMLPHRRRMTTSSKLAHRIDAISMDQRSGSPFGFQASLHPVAHLGCNYHVLGMTPSLIIQFLAPVVNPVSVLVGCSREATNQDGIVGPSSCRSLINNASQLWYLVDPYTDMSTLPMGCEVVAKGIPVPSVSNE
uniref:Uncharacterized protein n=1 Tax=Zea mays TaxID=4577 RepID=C4J348_MAIZE|nr:unknown [Zea mays]|eukprot:NP_001183061.1 uncharacterized protein LOC100501408 [Zea mays]